MTCHSVKRHVKSYNQLIINPFSLLLFGKVNTAESIRSTMMASLKDPSESGERIETRFLSYLNQGVLSGQQELFGMFDSEIIHIIIECQSIFLIEKSTEISTVRSHKPCHIRQLKTWIEEQLFFDKQFVDNRRYVSLQYRFTSISITLYCIRLLQLIQHRLMPIQKVRDYHPRNQRTEHISIVEIYIKHIAARRPNYENDEEASENAPEPMEIDIFLIRETLLELALITSNIEEHQHISDGSINGTATSKNIKPTNLASESIHG